MAVSATSFKSTGTFVACNTTKYNEWKALAYTGSLQHVSTFWIYQTQSNQILLTQELALALSLDSCKKSFRNLYDFEAGRNGPIDIQHSFKAMCTPTCLESDILIQSIMLYTSCSCLELSTQPNDMLYTSEGDLCQQNSARLLCELVGYCGVWQCNIGDFMCPRFEFNKKRIPLKNKLGSCVKISNEASKTTWRPILTLMYIFVTVCSFLFRF